MQIFITYMNINECIHAKCCYYCCHGSKNFHQLNNKLSQSDKYDKTSPWSKENFIKSLLSRKLFDLKIHPKNGVSGTEFPSTHHVKYF